jgi:hypothetical protein
MAERSGYSDLVEARRDTAAQLLAVVSALERMQANGASAVSYGGLRDSTASESLTLLRQVVRLLTLIQSSQSVARVAAQGTGGIGEAGGGGGGIGGFFGDLLGVVSKGLGLASIVTSIVGLFRGPHQPESVPIPFTAPASLSLEVANTDQILRGFPRFDFSATGERRLAEGSGNAVAPAPSPDAPSGPPPEPPVQITVNVSAIDSRSFRDYAPELAEAVRDAMLHLHPIHQVIRDWM